MNEKEAWGLPYDLEILAYPNQPTDVAVIRQPRGVGKTKVKQLAEVLGREKFLVVGVSGEETWHPTDRFREIGERIFSNGDEGELEQTLRFLAAEVGGGIDIDAINRRIVKVGRSFIGGFYVYLGIPHNIFMGSCNEGKALGWLRQDGWEVVNFPHRPVRLPRPGMVWSGGEIEMDFDGLVSLFEGRDGRAHALVAQAFADDVTRVCQDMVIIHQISNEEAGKGHGCNVADLRGGQVLVPPNRIDAPTAMGILRRYANARIIEAPPGFFDSTSGPRCNLCSFSL